MRKYIIYLSFLIFIISSNSINAVGFNNLTADTVTLHIKTKTNPTHIDYRTTLGPHNRQIVNLTGAIDDIVHEMNKDEIVYISIDAFKIANNHNVDFYECKDLPIVKHVNINKFNDLEIQFSENDQCIYKR